MYLYELENLVYIFLFMASTEMLYDDTMSDPSSDRLLLTPLFSDSIYLLAVDALLNLIHLHF